MGVGRVWSLDPLMMYEGNFGADGQPNGYGRYSDTCAYYEGTWSTGQPHGSGKLIYKAGCSEKIHACLN
jgi:hypothetical protein